MVQNSNIKSGKEKSILQLEAIVEESHDAIIGKTLEGVIVSWNGGATKMFGYSRGEIIGKSLADLFIPEHRNELPELLLKIKQGETITDYDSIWVKKDGTSAEVEFSISPVHTAEGMIIGSSLVGRDVTQRNALEKKLKKSESKYRSIFTDFIDLYYRADMQGILTDVSPSCFTLTGWKPEELLGKSVLNVYSNPEKRKAFLEKLMSEGKVFNYEISLLNKEGKNMSVLVSSNVIKDEQGNPKYIEGVMRDITELNKAKEKKDESEEKYKILTELSPDCIKLFDLQGNLLFINRGGKKEHNLKNELDVKNFKTVDSVIEEDKPKFIKALEDAKNGIGSIIEIRHTKEGSVRDICSEVIEPIKDIKGNVTGIFAVSRDLTEAKKSEEELKKSKDVLQSKFDEMEKMNKLMIDRELTMIELKKKITELEKDGV